VSISHEKDVLNWFWPWRGWQFAMSKSILAWQRKISKNW